ncbi:uncharacterized protein PAC_06272 [Phialocephala subalpina]|uniref:T6SS Phospholipase effector Tle1-like catalytic domain-containing protein n=1 Tax=Phialocephala subalpina TaxID=576137 RepID=A0A1L7WUB8_9HELO|nr:uncharacterized protein PAC_06272 [Phialocephala subalpina]
MSSPQLKPLILLCDGTWCGREASTKTNIYELAEMIGISMTDANDEDEHFFPPPGYSDHSDNGKKARYIHGVGLGSTFLDYIFNGITAQDIAEQCISAYRYIVNNYAEGENEIWMFGLSRGAYTVRCVGGMINNCGIVKRGGLDDGELDLLCREVYRIYRSPYEIDTPHSEQSESFRKHASWPLIGDDDYTGRRTPNPPIRFMGLFDTVGELGMPTFSGGVGLDWPKFYDENISSVVEHVYQAVSLHDRLYIFQPCLARRDTTQARFKDEKNWNITERWFPGVHYDLGRQRFKFLRDAGGAPWEQVLARLGFVSKVIEPNHVLADLVLKWMLEAIKEHDHESFIVSDVDAEIEKLRTNIISETRKIGDGDVYNRIVEYAPFGELGLKVWRTVAGTGSRVNAIYELLFALRDRHIPENTAEVYDYENVDPGFPESNSIQVLAGINQLKGDGGEDEKKRYPSRALEAWTLRRRVSQ